MRGAGDAPRVALIGARRVRQGLGPFVAEKLVASGAEVVGFLATSEASYAATHAGLAARGVNACGTTDFEELLTMSPDALAILSPSATHARFLELALEAGLSVLCEKPLIWPPVEPGPGSGGARADERVSELTEAFAARGLLLAENCQWPYVLPALRELHPGLKGRPSSFSMRLSPASTGLERLGDSLPHPLSVLQALAPGRDVRIEELEFSDSDPQSAELGLNFSFISDGHPVRAKVLLHTTDEAPRPASLAVDGRRAERLIRTRDYSMFLASGSRLVDLPDPLGFLISDFVRGLESCRLGRETDATRRWRVEIPQRARLLQEIVRESPGA